MIKSHLPLKPVEFLVLAVLKDGALHGYGMVQEIAARTDGTVTVRPGDLYRVLYRMINKGLLEAVDRKRAGSAADERRTYYRITRLGRDVAAAEARLLAKVAADVMEGSGTVRPA